MKILYVTTISDTVNAFLIPHIKMLIESGNMVDLAFHTNQPTNPELLKFGCKIYEVPFDRNPINFSNVLAFQALKKIINNGGYDVVHTHTPIASFLSRSVCLNFKKIKVIYTAHGLHFYKGAPLLNWLIYFPLEFILSKYTDVMILINSEDFNFADKYLRAKKICYVPGVGIDIEMIHQNLKERDEIRESLKINSESFVIISIGELNKNKNHKVIIKALKSFREKDFRYFICGEGSERTNLEIEIDRLGLANKIKLLGYRTDVKDILNSADLLVFPSFREGLPLSLIEGMALGKPIICSNARGNTDLIKNQYNGIVVSKNDVKDYSKSIEMLFDNREIYKEFVRKSFLEVQKYDIKNILGILKEIYINEI